MPEVNGVSDANDSGSAENQESQGTDQVSVESYKRLLAQRKADKARAKELQEELNTVKAEREAAEATKLAEQNEFKKLYETEKAKREAAEGRLTEMTTSQVTSAKKQALDRELGGIKKAEYLNFADLSKIQMNDDGTVDSESLKAIANAFRQSYPELLPTKAGGNIPNGAPGDVRAPTPKNPADMTAAELRAAYAADPNILKRK